MALIRVENSVRVASLQSLSPILHVTEERDSVDRIENRYWQINIAICVVVDYSS